MLRPQVLFFLTTTVLCLAFAADKILPPGFYDVVISSFERCPDVGTNDLDFGLHLQRINAKTVHVVGNVTLKRTGDDKVRIEFHLDKWGNGGWRLNSYTHKEDNACEAMARFLGKSFNEVMAHCIQGDCLKRKPGRICPLLPGIYETTDFDIKNIKRLNIPAGIEGKWRVGIETYSKADNVLLGCFKVILDCKSRGV